MSLFERLNPKTMMENNLFRITPPKRTYEGPELNPYQKYKSILEIDFNKRCGYTDCNQVWFGGKRSFHIDHFKPKSKFPELSTKYSNLVYSCSYVNIAKSDDISDYLDPVMIDYNEHFFRDNSGNIYPADDSPTAKYMHIKLKLYLKRYSIIFMLEKIRNKMTETKILIENIDNQTDKTRLLTIQGELANEFLDYLKYLEVEQ